MKRNCQRLSLARIAVRCRAYCAFGAQAAFITKRGTTDNFSLYKNAIAINPNSAVTYTNLPAEMLCRRRVNSPMR